MVTLSDEILVNTLPVTFYTTLKRLPAVLLFEQKRVDEAVQREPDRVVKSLVLVTVTVLVTKVYWEGIVMTTMSPDWNLLVAVMVSVNF